MVSLSNQRLRMHQDGHVSLAFLGSSQLEQALDPSNSNSR